MEMISIQSPPGTFAPTAATRAVLRAITFDHDQHLDSGDDVSSIPADHDLPLACWPHWNKAAKLGGGPTLFSYAEPLLTGRGVDWGCGVGPLAIAIASNSGTKRTKIAGLDLSPENVAAASRNVAVHGLESSVRCFESDSFASAMKGGKAHEWLFSDLDNESGSNGKQLLDFVVANPPASPGEGFEWRRRVLRGASPLLRSGGAVFLQISLQYSEERIRLLAERDAPEFTLAGCVSTTPWVPFDQKRDDLRQQLRDYAVEEGRGGIPYTFRHPDSSEDSGEFISAREALAEFEKTGRSPLSRWQTWLFVKRETGSSPETGLVGTRTGSLVGLDTGLMVGFDPENASDGGMLLPEALCRLASHSLQVSSAAANNDGLLKKSQERRLDPWRPWRDWADLSYAQLAAEVVWPCLAEHSAAFPGGKSEFEELMEQVYSESGIFQSPEVVPVVQPGNMGFLVAELFHGPTLSFKDYALQPTVAILDRILRQHGKHAECVVGTSGDTGSAAIEAVRSNSNSERARLAVLLPGGNRVSKLQRLQMTTAGAPNARSFIVEGGSSDSVDEILLRLFDIRKTSTAQVCTINSTNPLRIMCQMTHFFWAYFRAREVAVLPSDCKDRADWWPNVTFVLPTGALGNGVAGYATKLAGLPVNFVLATNENDVLGKWLADPDRTLRVRPSVATSSPAIDISFPYNVERLLYLLEIEAAVKRRGLDSDSDNSDKSDSDSDAALTAAAANVARQMSDMRTKGEFTCSQEVFDLLRGTFRSSSATEADVVDSIRAAHADCGYVLDTHTAVAVSAVRKLGLAVQDRPAGEVPPIVLATAHPVKVASAVADALGLPSLPGDIPEAAKRALDPKAVEEATYLAPSSGETAAETTDRMAHEVSEWFDSC
jgi:threonine synthase